MSEYSPKQSSEYWPGEWLPRDAITPNDWNPNELSDEEFDRLVASIEDNGWTMPIVIHAEEHYIIDGEHRWAAAAELDDPDLTPEDVPSDYVPVYGITVDETQAKLATVQHNRARGNVRVDRLKAYLEDLDDRDVLDMVTDKIGVSDDDVSELLGEITTPDLPDEVMPWEEDETEDTTDDEETETPIPQLDEDRTFSLRPESEVGVDVAALEGLVSEELTFRDETDYAIVAKALGTEMRAQSLLNLCRYVLEEDALDEIGA